MAMIKAENLTFSYPSSYDNIFENVNFQIQTGNLVLSAGTAEAKQLSSIFCSENMNIKEKSFHLYSLIIFHIPFLTLTE